MFLRLERTDNNNLDSDTLNRPIGVSRSWCAKNRG